MLKGWREGTQKQYIVYLNKWCNFCRCATGQPADPLQPTLKMGLDFLTSLYNSGVGYSGVNTARSALSVLLTFTDISCHFGTHPAVTRLLRGVFNQRPSLPRYQDTWDPDVVLNFIRLNWADNNSLALRELTLKTVALLALASAQRVQTLHLLKASNIVFNDDQQCTIHVDELLKQSRPGHHLAPITLKIFEERCLCIVTTLRCYCERTATLRNDDFLFIGCTRPHKRVSAASISRWLKRVLSAAGVAPIFKPHSIRGAVASKDKRSGVPLRTILTKAGWASENTFKRFYDRNILS